MGETEKDIDVAHVNDLGSQDAIVLATEADTTIYSPWTKAMFKLYGILAIAFLCGCLNGFDGSLMGAINAMKPYQDYFGM
jgi:hypothetical protein